MNNDKKFLSSQDIRILRLVARGMNSVGIAKELNIRARTAEHYVYKVMRKTGIHSRVLLAFFAYDSGFIAIDEIKDAIQSEKQRVQDEMLRIAKP